MADREQLFHADYAESVWEGLFAEFNSAAAVVWTIGNGTAGFAAIRQEIPMLGLTINDAHLSIVKHYLDARIALAMHGGAADKQSSPKLIALGADLKRKAEIAQGGEEGDGQGKLNAKRKTKKAKEERENAENSGSDMGGEDADAPEEEEEEEQEDDEEESGSDSSDDED